MGNGEQGRAYFHHLVVKFFHRDCLAASCLRFPSLEGLGVGSASGSPPWRG
ncbi:MAG: hypothetical protein F6K47_20935 [Symploca sp. SIO2E6]|nr:hypothetical protein [Symploca sp. SIO2E6]